MITDSVGKEIGHLSANHIADFVSGNMTYEMKFNTAIALMSDSVTDNMDYAGLGYAEVIAHISDMDAAQKFEDGRYLTVSIGVMTDKAICSICKQDLVKDGPCEHIPGREYDGRKAFLVTGSLHYEELSAVNVPADPHASVISLSRNGFTDSLQVENDKDGSFCTGIFCFTDSCSFEQKEKNMKKSDKHDEQKFDLASLLKAESVSAEDKAKAQLTLVKWMKARSDDKGRFLFVDRQTNDLMGGYSANVHPMIVPYKDGAVFVCSEIVTDNGDRVTADFLTVKVGDDFKIVEVIMNNRDSVKKMMGM
jgi:hypothetical protein